MSRYVAKLLVEPSETQWRADEVPNLTASALYRREPWPDPIVPKSALRRLSASELRSRAVGRALTAREVSQLERLCIAAGLPGLPSEALYSKWGETLEICNANGEKRRWWACLIPPNNPNLVESVSWELAAEQHRNLLKEKIEDGQIQARFAGTLVPANRSAPLERLILTRSDLEVFCTDLAIEVVSLKERPHFVTCARPRAVPVALLSLPSDALISYEYDIGGWRGEGVTTAKSYLAEIEATIARQKEGFFTLCEVAQILMEAEPFLDGKEVLSRVLIAHASGKLAIHKGGSRFTISSEEAKSIRDFYDTVNAKEFDAWLRGDAGYGFLPEERESVASKPENFFYPLETAAWQLAVDQWPDTEASRVMARETFARKNPDSLPPMLDGEVSDRAYLASARRDAEKEVQAAIDLLLREDLLPLLSPFTSLPTSERTAALVERATLVRLMVEGKHIQKCETSQVSNRQDEGQKLMRRALIEKHLPRWPTAERDFKDAHKNGLSSEAKAPGKGWWSEERAIRWAKVRGKYVDPSNALGGSLSTIHLMGR